MKALRTLLRAAPLLAFRLLSAASANEVPLVEPSGVLTLTDAVALALAHHPELRVAAAEVQAKQALVGQAGLLPNPEIQGDVENVGGSGARTGFEETESTLRLSQLIELGGKRGARQRLAALDRDLAAWDEQAKRLAIRASTTKAFVGTLAAQERVRLATDLVRLSQEALGAVQRSIRAGASASIEATRARVALGRVTIERARAERELDAARTLLAASWGTEEARFTSLSGDLATRTRLPAEATLVGALVRNPDIARFATERDERRAALAVEEAKRVPNVTVGAGARHFSDNGDDALVVGLAVPLPVFDRNQGGILAAHHRLAGADAAATAAHLSARTALAEAYQRSRAAHEAATELERDILPNARAALRGTIDALHQGLLRPGDVLEAQRTLLELQGEYIRALESVHLAAADMERLCATPLRELANGGDR